jgi:hypothetical protein
VDKPLQVSDPIFARNAHMERSQAVRSPMLTTGSHVPAGPSCTRDGIVFQVLRRADDSLLGLPDSSRSRKPPKPSHRR